MELEIYQIDAFASERFAGNPAAVCVLQEGINGDLMQAIANENNLSETAFVVRSGWGSTLRILQRSGHNCGQGGALSERAHCRVKPVQGG